MDPDSHGAFIFLPGSESRREKFKKKKTEKFKRIVVKCNFMTNKKIKLKMEANPIVGTDVDQLQQTLHTVFVYKVSKSHHSVVRFEKNT